MMEACLCLRQTLQMTANAPYGLDLLHAALSMTHCLKTFPMHELIPKKGVLVS